MDLTTIIALVIIGVVHFYINIRMMAYLYTLGKPGVLEFVLVLLFGWIVALFGYIKQDILEL